MKRFIKKLKNLKTKIMENKNNDALIKTSKKTLKAITITVVAVLSLATIAMAAFTMPEAKTDIELATINYEREVSILRDLEEKLEAQRPKVETSECDLAAVKLKNFEKLNATEEQKVSWSQKSSWGCLGK